MPIKCDKCSAVSESIYGRSGLLVLHLSKPLHSVICQTGDFPQVPDIAARSLSCLSMS